GDVEQCCKDGSTIQVRGTVTRLDDENGVPYGFTSVFRDVTELKTQERKLRYHASLQENVSDAVVVTDMDFRIQSWNKAAERIYGWNGKEVTGKVVYEILSSIVAHSDNLELSKQQLLEQGWWQGELVHHDKAGNSHNILESLSVIRDENETPVSIIAINH